MGTIPEAPIKRMLKANGANRVSEEAVVVLIEIIEKNINTIAEKAVVMASVANRKTIKASDIHNAMKMLNS